MNTRVRFLTIFVFLLLSVNVCAADEWVSVRSKNFHLIGNAKESDIKSVAVRLEQFRQVFGHLFPNIRLNDPVETNVIVFKDKKSYEPFLPEMDNGRPDKWIAGYFLGDREANYITLTADRSKKDTFEIIFHEYVHYLLNNNFKRSEIPPWLNEGLAEYYSTFEIEDDQKVMLGNLRNDHVSLLSSNELIPLRQFFKIDNYSLNKKGGHSRSIFYAQAWALIHYFAVKKESERLSEFVELTRSNPDSESAFKEAFGLDYDAMESVLRRYVKQKTFTRIVASFKERLSFDAELESAPLTEFEALGFLGDLLYRKGKLATAESYLERALTGDPEQVRANTSMGLLKLRLEKADEAKSHLEKAIAKGDSSYYAHYSYAFLLSRENMSEDGYVKSYAIEKADLMRTSLRKAIELNPEFIESYNLYAFVNLVMNENLDEAAAHLKRALALQPGSDRASLGLAQVYIRQQKFEEAESYANGIIESTLDESLRDHASRILRIASDYRDFEARRQERLKRFENGGDPDGNGITKRRRLSDVEVEEIRAELHMSKLNSEVIKVKTEERQFTGYFEGTICTGNNISYRFKTAGGKILGLSSHGFQNLKLLALVHIPDSEVFGCGFRSSVSRVVINFKPDKSNGGILTAVTFVPSIFRLKSAEEIRHDKKIIYLRHPETGEMWPFEDSADSNEQVREIPDDREDAN